MEREHGGLAVQAWLTEPDDLFKAGEALRAKARELCKLSQQARERSVALRARCNGTPVPRSGSRNSRPVSRIVTGT
jgi:hypothetical protein